MSVTVSYFIWCMHLALKLHKKIYIFDKAIYFKNEMIFSSEFKKTYNPSNILIAFDIERKSLFYSYMTEQKSATSNLNCSTCWKCNAHLKDNYYVSVFNATMMLNHLSYNLPFADFNELCCLHCILNSKDFTAKHTLFFAWFFEMTVSVNAWNFN